MPTPCCCVRRRPRLDWCGRSCRVIGELAHQVGVLCKCAPVAIAGERCPQGLRRRRAAPRLPAAARKELPSECCIVCITLTRDPASADRLNRAEAVSIRSLAHCRIPSSRSDLWANIEALSFSHRRSCSRQSKPSSRNAVSPGAPRTASASAARPWNCTSSHSAIWPLKHGSNARARSVHSSAPLTRNVRAASRGTRGNSRSGCSVGFADRGDVPRLVELRVSEVERASRKSCKRLAHLQLEFDVEGRVHHPSVDAG